MVHIASTGAYQGQSVAKRCTMKQMSFKSVRVCVSVCEVTRGIHLHD